MILKSRGYLSTLNKSAKFNGIVLTPKATKFVSPEDQEIIDDVKKNGGDAILTDSNHKTGTDRIFQALKKYNQKDIDFVMNIQGDEPMIDIGDIKSLNIK